MIVRIKKFSYAPTESEGILTINETDVKLATIAQPWVPNPNGAKGGKPFHSCVPDGMYQLLPWTSPSKGEVYIIYNPDLGVYKFPQDHAKDRGRNLCLLHLANFASELQGCEAPGIKRALLENRRSGEIERAVASSGAAMDILRRTLGRDEPHILSIESVIGAHDGTV